MTGQRTPRTADRLYRWEPGPSDCRRHDGPHESFHCNGAVGRYIEADLDVERLAAALYESYSEAGFIIESPINHLHAARVIAAEYARLAAEEAAG